MKSVADAITISDEAFVLLALENNWDRWVDINNKCQNKFTPSKRGRNDPIESDILPKHTFVNSNKAKKSEDKNQSWKGWNNAGIKQFDFLCKLVKKNRVEKQLIDRKVCEALDADAAQGKEPKRKRRKTLEQLTKAHVDGDDLSDIDSNDSEISDSEQACELRPNVTVNQTHENETTFANCEQQDCLLQKQQIFTIDTVAFSGV